MSENQIYAGIDIGGTNIKFGLFNRAGEILYQDKKPTMAQKGRAPLLNLLKNIGEILLLHAAEENLNLEDAGRQVRYRLAGEEADDLADDNDRRRIDPLPDRPVGDVGQGADDSALLGTGAPADDGHRRRRVAARSRE